MTDLVGLESLSFKYIFQKSCHAAPAHHAVTAQLRLKTDPSVDVLLICWCHIVCAVRVVIPLFAIVPRVSSANGQLMGGPRLLTALHPGSPVCSLCTAPLLLADQLPDGSPDKILGICRRNERGIKGDGYWTLRWQRSGLLFSYSKPPSRFGRSPFHMFVFPQDVTEECYKK